MFSQSYQRGIETICSVPALSSSMPLNRTNVELKRGLGADNASVDFPLNRTNVELKLDPAAYEVS